MLRIKPGAAGLCLAGMVGLCAGPALADRIDFFVYENADGADVTGLDLWAELSDGGSYIDITFYNDSTAQSVVTAVYFEQSDFSAAGLDDGRIVLQIGDVSFSDGASPSNPAPPGMGFGGAWLGNIHSAGADSPPSKNGINAGVGESLTVRFDYIGGTTFDDVKNALFSGGPDWRIAQHVQGVGPDGELSVWTITVPTPGALALLGLAGLATLRRRR